jgi:hypothetical protein
MEEEKENPRRVALERLRLAALTHLAASVAAGVALERNSSKTSQEEAAHRLAAVDGPSVLLDIAAIATTKDPKRLKALAAEHSARAKSRIRTAKSIADAGI